MTLIKEIKKIIQEERKQRTGLLAIPLNEETVSMRPKKQPVPDNDQTQVVPPPVMTKSGHDTAVDPTIVEPNAGETDIDGDAQDTQRDGPADRVRDLRPGFNLYHGVMTQVFTQLQSMGDETQGGEIVKRVTQWALQQLGHDEDTQRVFQSSSQPVSPQVMSAIVQKAMLIILNHVSKEAEREAIENDVFDMADHE
jgi:hypothetical protein